MLKIFLISLLVLASLFTSSTPIRALPPTPNITPLSSTIPSNVYFNDDLNPSFRTTEITPWSLENHSLGGNYLFLISSFQTYLCDSPVNIFTLSSLRKIENCILRQSSTVKPDHISADASAPLWSRDYYGAFSGHIIQTKNQGVQLYTINHGELLNNNYFSTLPERCVLAPNIGYGTYPCTPENNSNSYNAFIGLSNFGWNIENFNSNNLFSDLGPIVWPANGYVKNGKKATVLGILHPSSIIKDNYLYVYFRDTSKGTEPGRTAGLKVARAPITDSGINPLSFKTYINGSFTDSALPAGFNKAQISNFFASPGGRSSALFGPDNSNGRTPDMFSFSVAKIKNSNWYLGVGQDIAIGIILRLSPDLVNWGPGWLVPGTEFVYSDPLYGGTQNFIKEPFLYPRLANKNGDSNVEIDANEFYITGVTDGLSPYTNSHAKIVNQLRLKITLPTDLPGDFDKSGKVDESDYNLIKANFGRPYTLLDYNLIATNIGS